MRRRTTWLPKLLRVCALVAVLLGAALVVAVQTARARLDETFLSMGESMLRYDRAIRQDRPRTIHLNGHELKMAVGSTRDDVHTVLDSYEAACKKRDGRFVEHVERMQARHRAGRLKDVDPSLLDGTLRAEGGNQGYVACLDMGEGRIRRDELIARIHRFERTFDVSDVGHLRYVFVERPEGQPTRFVAAWTDGPLPVSEMFPAHGDAPGRDVPGIPRPPTGRRLLSAWEQGQLPYSATQYVDVGRGPLAMRRWYRKELAGAGWKVLATRKHRGPPTLVVERRGRQVLLTFGANRRGRGFVNVLTMH